MLAVLVGLPSSLLLGVAACAATEDAEGRDIDRGVNIPPNDAGAEAEVDAATDGDAASLPCFAGNLCAVQTPLTLGSIAAMSGRSKDDVWASGTNGLLLHWSGQTWTALESSPDAGVPQETLSSLFLTADEVWGVAGSLVLRRGLDPQSVRTARFQLLTGGLFRSLSGIAVLPGGTTYVSIAPGYQGMKTKYFAQLDFETKGLTYAPDAVHPLTNEKQSSLGILALSLVAGKALWLVGERGTVVRHPLSLDADGGAPIAGQGVVVPLASQANLLAAWGQDEHLWAAGTNGTIVHFDGTAWHLERSGTTVTFNAIFGLSPTDIWAAGDEGTVLHFDGAAWSPVAIGDGSGAYRGSLRAIWASGRDDVWIGGGGGIFHWGTLP